MYKIIGGDGKEYGPVTLEQLRQWIAEGRVNAQTLIQAEGSPDWKPLAAYAELGEPAPHATAPAPPAAPGVEAEAQDYELGIGDCITRGWELVKANLGILLGGTVLVMVVQGVIQTPGSFGRMLIEMGGHRQPGLLIAGGLLALIGGLAALILTGPITGGLYWPYLLLLRGQPAQIGDFFAGFKRGFVNLMLCQIVISLLVAVCIIPGAVGLGIGLVLHFAKHAPAGIGLLVVGGLLLLVGALIAVYLSVCWFYALPLVVDRQIGFWEAMTLSKRKVSQHWWQVFGLTLVAGLIGAAGIILCCVGVIFTAPIAIASFMSGYEVIFGRRPA